MGSDLPVVDRFNTGLADRYQIGSRARRMKGLSRHRFRSASLLKRGLSALLLASAFSCSDGATTPNEDDRPPPPPYTADVVISGPSSVFLDCSLEGFGKFSSSGTTGNVYKFTWHVDGVPAGEGPSLKYDFVTPDTYSVRLSALDANSSVLDSDSLQVTVAVPSDISQCMGPAFLDGRWGLLLPADGTPASSSYVIRTPAAIKDLATGYVWRFQQESSEPVEIAAGADADSVWVNFPAEGEYSLSVDQLFGDDAFTSTIDVRVRSGEPLAESGKILFYDQSTDVHALRFMDGETGYLSEPILTSEDSGFSGTCSPERVVFAMAEKNSTNRMLPSIFEMRHDGTGLRRLVDFDGSEQQPDFRNGKVVFIANRRWNYRRDELAIYDYRTDEAYYLAGEVPDTLFVAGHPVFGASTDEIIAGEAQFGASDGSYPLAVYTRYAGNQWVRRRLHFLSAQEAYGWSPASEGLAGVAWDPRNELVAYTVTRHDIEAFNVLAVAALNGSSVKVIAEDVGGDVYFTPSGSHVIFSQLNQDVIGPNESYSIEMVMVPRDGGSITRLSRAAVSPQEYVRHFPLGYCSDKDS